MIELENFKSNLEVEDKYDIKRNKIDKGKVYAGRTEYINPQIKPIEHTSPLLAAAVLGLDNTGAPLPENPKFFDTWTDIDAQEIQLNTKPTCYLILGKPGLGAFKLGEAMAAKYNIIHLSPRNMLVDEIEQKSSTGRTWEFNMRQNKVCCYDMILAMLKIKLNSEVVQHRGYVISGVPFVTCCKKHLSIINSLYGEEGFLEIDEMLFETIRDLKKKKKKPPPGSAHSSIASDLPALGGEEEVEEEEEEEEKQEEEENLEEEEDKPAELPTHLLDSCSDIIVHKEPRFESKLAMILNQLNELFSLTLKPDIIIHLTCPELDIVKLRSHIYINYKTGIYVNKPFTSNYKPEPSWPRKCRIGGYVDSLASDVFNPKYNCRAPSNFKEKVIDELCNYKNNVVPFLEKKFKDFDPKMIIELDGRASTNQKLHQVSETLILMQIQPVIIPKPLFLEEAPEDLEEFWESVGGLDVVNSGVVNFKYYASPWFNRCPIEQKLRRSVAGKPKYAVMFFKHVYLMFSINNFVSFYKNPRPYLKLKYLEPNCRVMVVGTKSSGKTMISQCLSWIFDAPLFTYNTILEYEREKKYYLTSVTILSEIIATIEDARFLQWQETEAERKANLNEWCVSARALLKKYLLLFIEKTEFEKRKAAKILKQQLERIKRRKQLQKKRAEREEEAEEEEEEKIDEIEEEFDPDMLSQLNTLETELCFLPIFLLNSIEECRNALKSQNISEYAPIELLTVTDMPAIPVIGDEDVTAAITRYIEANDLQKDLEPTTEEMMTVIVKLLTEIDTKHQEDTQSEQLYGKYIMDGFPSEPEYWEYLDPKLFPDYTIALIENREIDDELYQHYSSADTCSKRFDEKILLAKDPLIHTKLQSTKFSNLQDDMYLDIQKIVNTQLNDSLDLMFNTEKESEPKDDANSQAQFISSFTEAIEKFRENWDSLKIKIDENSKSYIEIELENKTDVEIIEETLYQLRQCYRPAGRELDEDEEPDDANEDEDDPVSIDLLTYNDHRFLCETNIYCPIAYYDHHVLWQGKPEFSFKYDNKIHYFCKEEFVEIFKNSIAKYQFYNIPYKKIPKLKICVIGSIGSGATSLSKYLAKELGLLHIDFADIINEYLVPKHFKKIGRQYENIFVDGPIEEEGVVDFQMDEENENLISDILGNEKELKRMFFEYFERGTPVLSKLMQRLLNKIWFDSNSPIGFVLDGYPKISNDIEDMMECYAIPDIVIELENDVETAIERIAPIMFKSWKSQQIEAKKAAAAKLKNERKMWLDFLAKEIVPKLIIEELFENMFFLVPEPLKTDSAGSVLIDAHPSGSNLDPNMFKFYNEMVEQHPEPQDTTEWEKSDEARERIEGRIEGIFESYEEGIESVKEMLMEQRIKTVTVKATRPFNKVTRSTLSKLKNLRNRCESFFEQTFIVTTDIAEILLIRGFYFYSKFYRLCPVYIFENPQTIHNPYKISIRKGTLFPVVHRTYIYFISSADNVIKFRTNPLKYITCDAIKTYYEYPLRIGVIGPPKSGQSSLAARLAKQYGLLCISPGSAVRNILENLHWTELAAEMIKCLKDGNKIGEDHIVKAMQIAAIDHRTVTCGYVLDGAPLSPYRATGHAKGCLFPNIIFDICTNKSRILENSQNEIHYDILKYMPPYSYPLIQLRYEHWERKQHKIRNWIAEDYQNLFALDGSLSQWHVLQQASDHLSVLTSQIHYYIDNVDKKIVPAIMVSNETFQERQSAYKKMCPVCFHKKVYNHMGSHIRGKTGVVQYQKTFYWICNEHMDMVMTFPHRYLSAIEVKIPEMPALINIVNLDYVYENGICIVTYAENLPGQVIKIGTNQYAASYAGKSYLFCSKVCLCKFVSKPYLYKDITIFKNPKSFPKLSLKNLPNLGYLEQILGNILTEACCSVNAFRPKYPGLSFQTSALIYIGLYLKTHNPLIDEIKLPMYLKAFRIFESRCKLLLNIGLRLRSMDNPFATYPKCDHRKPTLNPADVEQEYLCSSQIQGPSENIPERTSNYVQLHKPSYRQKMTRRVPVPDERFDYLCEFHKPVSKVPAFLNVVDIAGLVKGAAEGQGLGNAFLSHIKACDAIFNLCRAFDDEDVIHVDGEVNPVRDLETIGEELRLKDEEQLVQNFEKLDKLVNRGGDKKLKSEYDSLSKVKAVLVDEKKHIRFGDWSAADIEVLNKYLFLTSKPALYLVNLSEKDYIRKKNKWLPKLKEWIDKNDPGAPLIPFSGSLEMKLFDMEPAERQAFLKEHNLTSALDKIIVQGYKALQLEYFFTAGPDEVKAWTIQKGTKAPQAAGRIHTDFEKGFIMAEVMHYKDFKEEGTEAACKAAGKYRQQGRNYVVEDGDIIFFKFNAGAGLKDPKKK